MFPTLSKYAPNFGAQFHVEEKEVSLFKGPAFSKLIKKTASQQADQLIHLPKAIEHISVDLKDSYKLYPEGCSGRPVPGSLPGPWELVAKIKYKINLGTDVYTDVTFQAPFPYTGSQYWFHSGKKMKAAIDEVVKKAVAWIPGAELNVIKEREGILEMLSERCDAHYRRIQELTRQLQTTELKPSQDNTWELLQEEERAATVASRELDSMAGRLLPFDKRYQKLEESRVERDLLERPIK